MFCTTKILRPHRLLLCLPGCRSFFLWSFAALGAEKIAWSPHMETPSRKRGRPRVVVTEAVAEARRLAAQQRNARRTPGSVSVYLLFYLDFISLMQLPLGCWFRPLAGQRKNSANNSGGGVAASQAGVATSQAATATVLSLAGRYRGGDGCQGLFLIPLCDHIYIFFLHPCLIIGMCNVSCISWFPEIY